jgi:hypothetical protein
MDWQLAFNIVIGLGLILVGAWSFDARRLRTRILRLMQMQDGPPTEEIELPRRIDVDYPALDDFESGSVRGYLNPEDFGPGKPVPRVKYRNSW